MLKTYDDLFSKAVAEKGNLEPYLQQLERFDSRDIEEWRAEMALAKDISVRALKSGMMKSLSKSAIEKHIRIFLTPEFSKSHGRPINDGEAKRCKLKVETHEVKSPLWEACYELYIRADQYCSTYASKLIETKEHAYHSPLVQPSKKGKNDGSGR